MEHVRSLEQTPDPRRWIALAILLTGAFLPPLDFFIVNVALPSIREDFHASASTMQLIISGYATTYAVMLITGGRLGDLYGRRNVFLAGMMAFAAASALCGFAWSPLALVVGRVLQGFAAAIMAPQALASIKRHLSRSREIEGAELLCPHIRGGVDGRTVLGRGAHRAECPWSRVESHISDQSSSDSRSRAVRDNDPARNPFGPS